MSATNNEKHRVNISIDEDLHARATAHARENHYTGFSGLVTKLIVADLAAADSAKGRVEKISLPGQSKRSSTAKRSTKAS